MIVRAAALALAVLIVAAPAGAAPGTLDATEHRGVDEHLRVVGDGRGGLWLGRNDGLHHEAVAGGDETGPLAPQRAQHLGADPRNGDVVFDAFGGGLYRLSRAGVLTTITTDVINVATLDVGPDGDVYVSDSNGVRRFRGSAASTVVDGLYVEALAVAANGSIVFYEAPNIYRLRDGVQTRVAGDGIYCAAPNPCGDNGPALDASFSSVVLLDVAADGTIYVGELYGRIRRIRDGRVEPVAGGWDRCYLVIVDCNEGGFAPIAFLDNVVSMSLVDDALYAVDERGDGRGSRLLHIDDVASVPATQHQGYRMIASDGGVFSFGWSPFHGSTGDIRLVSPIVAGRSNGADGYWFVAGDGGVFTFGDATFYGSASGDTTSPVVDMAVRTDGRGYLTVERNGQVQSFGAATTLNIPDPIPYAAIVNEGDDAMRVVAEQPSSLPRLNVPIVAAHATRSGAGTWYVASDGGVFTDGDAGFFGSTGNLRLNQPVLDLIPTPTEQGYWLIAADGGVFTFGDAEFLGSMGAVRLNQPVVAGVAGPVASG